MTRDFEVPYTSFKPRVPYPAEMPKVLTSNFIPELDKHLDAETDDSDAASVVICQICRKRKLTISTLVRSVWLIDQHSTEAVSHQDQLVNLYAHGFEQTVVFPCGHVFGDRCIRDKYIDQSDVTCPSCGFRMTYTTCGHAIIPAIIPVRGVDDSIRDTFPLTIPEGGQPPRNCKECRWKAIRVKLRYALNSECVLCAQHARAKVQEDPIEHDVHRIQHIRYGIKEVITQIMKLIQPEFVTRETTTSAQKTMEDLDRLHVNTAMLKAIVLTELEDTIWYRTTTRQLTKEQIRKHNKGMENVDDWILNLLMQEGNNYRRMW